MKIKEANIVLQLIVSISLPLALCWAYIMSLAGSYRFRKGYKLRFAALQQHTFKLNSIQLHDLTTSQTVLQHQKQITDVQSQSKGSV